MTDSDPRHARAVAHPNIALVKYWGKSDAVLNIPAVESLSITLDTLRTDTRVVFDAALERDVLTLDGKPAGDAETQRVADFLDLFRAQANSRDHARVTSSNNFPTAAGLASSASGFAALAVAAANALNLDLPSQTLSALARRGSGSAARSIFGGFVHMARGRRPDGSDSFATQVMRSQRWPLRVVVAVTQRERKSHLSTAGMNLTRDTSPFYADWIASSGDDIATARAAIEARDFAALAAVSEHSCLKMHGLMLSARPGLIYWNSVTLQCLSRLRALQKDGCGVFFTIDAGPQVKAVCEPAFADDVGAALAQVPGVIETIQAGLGDGACVMT